MIIGISGKKGSGKTTIAEYLRDHAVAVCGGYIPPIVFGFASIIKDCYVSMFCTENDIMPEDLDEQEIKSAVHSCGKTHRQLLQEYGVAMREIWPDIWVKQWECWVDNEGGYDGLILVPDVRFPNEVKAIYDLGGKVIRLTRCPHPEDKHESETALDIYQAEAMGEFGEHSVKVEDEYKFNHIIDNANMSIDEQNKIALDYVRSIL